MLPPPQALVASWEGHTQSGEHLRNLIKNGAGVTSANTFIHNLEYKQDINKRRETCKLKSPNENENKNEKQ